MQLRNMKCPKYSKHRPALSIMECCHKELQYVTPSLAIYPTFIQYRSDGSEIIAKTSHRLSSKHILQTAYSIVSPAIVEHISKISPRNSLLERFVVDIRKRESGESNVVVGNQKLCSFTYKRLIQC